MYQCEGGAVLVVAAFEVTSDVVELPKTQDELLCLVT